MFRLRLGHRPLVWYWYGEPGEVEEGQVREGGLVRRRRGEGQDTRRLSVSEQDVEIANNLKNVVIDRLNAIR